MIKNFLAILRATISNRKVLLIVLSLLSVLFLWLYAATMETVAAQSEAVNEILKSFPPELMKALNVTTGDNASFTGFLATKQYGLMLPILILIVVSSFASSALAGEIDRGSILLHLNQPLSRLQLYWSKYLAGFLAMAFFVAISILPAIPLAELYDLSYSTENFLYFTLVSILFGGSLYSIGFLFSAVLSEGSKVHFLMTGVFLFFYFTNIAAALIEEISGLKYLSLLYYYDPALILGKLTLPELALPVMLALLILPAISGAILFKRRDISIR